MLIDRVQPVVCSESSIRLFEFLSFKKMYLNVDNIDTLNWGSVTGKVFALQNPITYCQHAVTNQVVREGPIKSRAVHMSHLSHVLRRESVQLPQIYRWNTFEKLNSVQLNKQNPEESSQTHGGGGKGKQRPRGWHELSSDLSSFPIM